MSVRTWWRRQRHIIARAPIGRVEFGALRRLRPISRAFGFDRGLPIDRYYIERFLGLYASDIQGHVLEIGDDTYTRKFGGDRVTSHDVLHNVEGNPLATIVADLARADQIACDTFDCIILTQTLQLIYDVRSALRHIHRALKPSGVLLMTGHGISRIAHPPGEEVWEEHWRFTAQSLKRLVGEFFSPSNVFVAANGNVLAAIASLHGLAAEELTPQELDHHDPDFELLITVRAAK